jgi:hypothetical protein
MIELIYFLRIAGAFDAVAGGGARIILSDGIFFNDI